MPLSEMNGIDCKLYKYLKSQEKEGGYLTKWTLQISEIIYQGSP